MSFRGYNTPVDWLFGEVKKAGEQIYDEYVAPWLFPREVLDNQRGATDPPLPVDPETDIYPYTPGAKELQEMRDSKRYWKDYKKNTGFSPRYPGMSIHTPDVGQLLGRWDWWKP